MKKNSKNDNKIYRGEDIVWDDGAIETKEIIEGVMALNEISLYLKEYRRKNNLTQVELAEMLEVNQVMVSKLERGNYNPTLKQLLKISYKLTRSNKMFFDMIKSISKAFKEDYTYNFDGSSANDKKIQFTKSKTKTKVETKKTNKNRKKGTQKVCA